MARRRIAAKREIVPDPVHGSRVVAKFINRLMSKGKKSIAEKIVYAALEGIAKQAKRPSSAHAKKEHEEGGAGGDAGEAGSGSVGGKVDHALEIFFKAIENVSPLVEVKSRRIGGATFQVPAEVRPDRREALGMRWLIAAAKARPGKSMANRLASEIQEAAEERGAAFRKKEDTHKMAKSNQAFASFR